MGLSIGIDIGTTKAAAVVFDTESGALIDSASMATEADLASAEGFHEQDPLAIFKVVEALVESLDPAAKSKALSIGVTGQMHGALVSFNGGLSRLATWKDKRASSDGSLAEINAMPGCAGLKDGFGLTTLAWLAANGGIAKGSQAATIHDMLVAKACGLQRPVCDPADAASWGLFDVFSNSWDMKAIATLGIPADALPSLAPAGSKAGALSEELARKWGVPAGTPVGVATGDNQASILATAKAPGSEIYLTVGTGAQLSVVVDALAAKSKPGTPAMELRPFFDGKLLAVVAPLCGGQAFAWLVKSLALWMSELGVEAPSEAELYKRLDALAMQAKGPALKVCPSFLGERHAPELRGSIGGMGLEPFSVGCLAASLSEGILQNMRSMMPDWVFEGRRKVVASGNAMRRLEVMKAKAGSVFGLPVEVPDSKEEAACGAAILASRLATGKAP